MKKVITLLIIGLVLTACLGKDQTVTVKSEKHGISVTGSKDEIIVESSIKLDEDTTIEFKSPGEE